MKLTAQFITGTIYVAILYMLVRPNSPAATTIQTVSNALIAVVGNATGAQNLGGVNLNG